MKSVSRLRSSGVTCCSSLVEMCVIPSAAGSSSRFSPATVPEVCSSNLTLPFMSRAGPNTSETTLRSSSSFATVVETW